MYEITRDYIKNGNARSGQQIKQVKFIVSHDIGDGGSTAYQNRTHFNNNQPLASAHAFIDDKFILEIIPLWEKAWHVLYSVPSDNKRFGDDANDVGIGVELCHGPKINFNEAYKRYVWYHAYLCKQFGLDPRKHIVSHSELDPGRRSDPQHALNPKGISWNKFIDDVAKAYGEKPKEQPKEQPKPAGKTIDQLAQEVIKGLHGSGDVRKKALGAQYDAVQARVNEIFGGGSKPAPAPKPQPSVDELARQVIDGKLGSGQARRDALGARYDEVQKRVNELLGAKPTAPIPAAKSISQLADEVIRGLHGSGATRKKSLGAQYDAVQAEVNRRLK